MLLGIRFLWNGWKLFVYIENEIAIVPFLADVIDERTTAKYIFFTAIIIIQWIAHFCDDKNLHKYAYTTK